MQDTRSDVGAGWTASTVRVEESDAILFDLDGVLTDTAAVHERAWARMFTEFLDDRAGSPEPYTAADYFAHVDGRPRSAGVRAVLRSRGIDLPEGRPDDGPDRLTMYGLGHRKNRECCEIFSLVEGGFLPNGGARRKFGCLVNGL